MTPRERSSAAFAAGQRAASIAREKVNEIIRQHDGHAWGKLNDLQPREVFAMLCRTCGDRRVSVEVTWIESGRAVARPGGE